MGAVLMKLALHYPRHDLTPSQFALVLEDMVSDLESLGVYQLERVADAWRRSGERFFPTSGQLLKIVDTLREESIERGRHQHAYKALLPPPPGRHPRELKPWREILAEHGRPIPPDHSPTAQALDVMQEGKARSEGATAQRKAKLSIAPISDALRERLNNPEGHA